MLGFPHHLKKRVSVLSSTTKISIYYSLRSEKGIWKLSTKWQDAERRGNEGWVEFELSQHKLRAFTSKLEYIISEYGIPLSVSKTLKKYRARNEWRDKWISVRFEWLCILLSRSFFLIIFSPELKLFWMIQIAERVLYNFPTSSMNCFRSRVRKKHAWRGCSLVGWCSVSSLW